MTSQHNNVFVHFCYLLITWAKPSQRQQIGQQSDRVSQKRMHARQSARVRARSRETLASLCLAGLSDPRERKKRGGCRPIEAYPGAAAALINWEVEA